MDTGNAETFEPTLDWSREWLHSAQWVATTFVLTLICLLLVLAALARFTVWGRQFWRVSGDYFTGRGSVPVWLLFGFLLLSTVISVRINVLLTYYVNDLFTALQVAFQGALRARVATAASPASGRRWWSSRCSPAATS